MNNDINYNINYYNQLINETALQFDTFENKIRKFRKSNDHPLDRLKRSLVDSDLSPSYMKKDFAFIETYGTNIDNSMNNIIESLIELRLNPSQAQAQAQTKSINNKCTLLSSDIERFINGLRELETLKIVNDKFGDNLIKDIRLDLKEKFSSDEGFNEGFNEAFNEAFNEGFDEEFNINDIGNKVKDAVVNPVKDVANNMSSSIKNVVNSSIGQVTSQVDNMKNVVNSGLNNVTSSVTGSVNTLTSQINSTISTIKSSTDKVISETGKITQEIPKQTTMITNMISSKIKEEFGKIQGFFNKFVEEITRIFNLMIEKFKMMTNEIVKISKMIAEFGENFYNKYLKPIFYEIFGVMKEVFIFIWNEVIPLLRRLIVFIVKELPILLRDFYTNMKRFSINLYNTSFISTLLVIGVFIGLQVYMKHLLNTDMTIPHVLLIFFTLTILWDQVMNNTKRLKSMQTSLISGIVWFFSLGPIRNLFNLSPDFGKNILKSIAELTISYSKNATKYTITFLILLVVLKVLGIKVFDILSDLILKILINLYDRTINYIKSR